VARAVLAAAALALALPPAAARAAPPPRIEARVDRTEVPLDGTLTLEVRVEGSEAPSSFSLPPDLPFEVLARSEGRESSLALGGGGGVTIRQVAVYTFALRPRAAGRAVVPPFTAVVSGKTLRSAPVAVQVLKPGAPPRGGRGPERPGATYRGWERDLVVRVEVDRREVWLGEQVAAAVWLHSPLGVVAYEGYKPPPFDGFWSEDLGSPDRLGYEVKEIDGIPTRAYLLQRLALFPTRAGTLEIGPFQVDVAVRTRADRAFDLFPDVRSVRRRSEPVKVEVRPLPAGAPDGFQAVNVGKLALEVVPSATEVAAGEAVALSVVASGEGNVRALALPALPPVPGARAFAPEIEDEVEPRGGRLAGARTVRTTFVPAEPGAIELPALAWPYFDPETGRYEVARTDPVRVLVRPGAAGAAALAPPPGAPAEAVRPIRTGGAIAPEGPPPWRSPLFALAALAPPAAFAALALARALSARRAAGAGARRLRGAGRAALAALDRAARLARDGPAAAALDAAERALVGYASDRLAAPAAGLTREALVAALAGAGAPAPGARALAAALDALDAARFGGGAADPGEPLAAAAAAVEALEAEPWREEGEP
jgi:hypothetical protein